MEHIPCSSELLLLALLTTNHTMAAISDPNSWLEDAAGRTARGKTFYALPSRVPDPGTAHDWECCESDTFGRTECFYDTDRYTN